MKSPAPEKFSKRNHRRLMVAAGVLAVLFYGFMQLMQGWSEAGYTPRGSAVSGIVQLAFGQQDFLKSYAKYDSPARSILIERDCHRRLPTSPSGCFVAAEQAGAFYEKCAAWRFERCVPLYADPLFLKQPKMMGDLKTILGNPCLFMPSKKDIDNEKVSQDDLVPLHQYLNWALAIGCDRPLTKSTKIVVTFGYNPGDPEMIIHTKLGR